MTEPWNPTAQPPPGYAAPPPGYYPQGDGMPGKQRSSAAVLGLAVVTLGIYVYVYNYKVHDEMKRHAQRGIGGGVALLITFLAGFAMLFLTPSEVGGLYTRKGQRAPVSGWTGLWAMGPAVIGWILALVVTAAAPGTTDAFGEEQLSTAGTTAFIAWGLVALAGCLYWLIKTNGALNRYWATYGR